jgi:membrane-associated protease RseP (regulator of RpoE activity)
MMNVQTLPTFLAAALILACASSAAQTSADASVDTDLAQAYAELEKAEKRVSELSVQGTSSAPSINFLSNRPVIGVLLSPDEGQGVLISGITPDGAAAKAGLTSGDRLLSVEGKQIAGENGEQRIANARELLNGLQADKTITLGYSRADNSHTVTVTPKISSAIALIERMYLSPDENYRIMLRTNQNGQLEYDPSNPSVLPPGLDKEVAFEMARDNLISQCQGEHCQQAMLAEAFRWNGLNLASVDAQLGRYFGTDRGVLVLSPGQDLEGLQAGDVIQSVAGKPVATPREAMDALRAAPAESKVEVEFLRDRQNARTEVQVPKSIPFRMQAPLAAPLPSGNPQVRVAPAGSPNTVTRRKIVMVDGEGNTRTFEDDGTEPLPPLPPAAATTPLRKK